MSDLDDREIPVEISGRYSVIRRLDGEDDELIFLVKDQFVNESFVLLKCLHPALKEDTEAVQRFRREMQAMRLISHPNVLRTYEVGEFDGLLYFTMELIDGLKLSELIGNGGSKKLLPWNQITSIFSQVAQGLQAIHAHDLVHRDLKAENIYLGQGDRVIIGNFAFVRTKSSTLTQKNVILGTITHVAPEIWNGSIATPQSDIYSLGILLYHLSTGSLPFESEDPAEVMRMHLSTPPEPVGLIRTDAPPWVDILLKRMLAKLPNERSKSVDLILDFLDSVVQRTPGAQASVSRSAALAKVPGLRKESTNTNISKSLKRPTKTRATDEDALEERLQDDDYTPSPPRHKDASPRFQMKGDVEFEIDNPRAPTSMSMRLIMKAFGKESKQEVVDEGKNAHSFRGKSLRVMLKNGVPVVMGPDEEYGKDLVVDPDDSIHIRIHRAAKRKLIETCVRFTRVGILTSLLTSAIIVLIYVKLSFQLWLDSRDYKTLPAEPQYSSNERGAVERFVRGYIQDRSTPALLDLHIQRLLTDINVFVPDTVFEVDAEKIRLAPDTLFISLHAVQVDAEKPAVGSSKKRNEEK